jgi:hypothetical protein
MASLLPSFKKKINKSLIQPIKVKYGQAEACRIHDIILDFITCKATEDNFVTSIGGTELIRQNSDCRARRLSIKNLEKEDLLEKMELSHVRSLTVFGRFVDK